MWVSFDFVVYVCCNNRNWIVSTLQIWLFVEMTNCSHMSIYISCMLISTMENIDLVKVQILPSRRPLAPSSCIGEQDHNSQIQDDTQTINNNIKQIYSSTICVIFCLDLDLLNILLPQSWLNWDNEDETGLSFPSGSEWWNSHTGAVPTTWLGQFWEIQGLIFCFPRFIPGEADNHL